MSLMVRAGPAIAMALQSVSVPKYLYGIVGDYFRDRSLMYDTSDGPVGRSGAVLIDVQPQVAPLGEQAALHWFAGLYPGCRLRHGSL